MKRGLKHKTHCYENRGEEMKSFGSGSTARPGIRTSGGMRISMGRGRGMGGGRRGMHGRMRTAKRSVNGTVLALGTSQKIRVQMSAEEELTTLKGQARAIENQLLAIKVRITELDQGHAVFPVVAVVDRDKCIACGACQEICPTGAIFIDEIAQIDPMKCMGCGQCVAQCPQQAIYLQKA